MPRILTRFRQPILFHSLVAVIASLCAGLGVYGLIFWNEIPVLNPDTFLQSQSIVVTDREGFELVRFHAGKDVIEIPAADMPQHLKNAFISIEDKRFRERPCVDVRALSRAAYATIFSQRVEGASTITQQLVGLLLDNRHERTLRRKANELLLACRMEWNTSRDDILAMYLNRVPFGGEIYGVEQASRTFFGKHARDLSVAQSAILASLPQRPTALNPYGDRRYSSVTSDTEQLIRDGSISDAGDLPEGSWTLGLIGKRFRSDDGDLVLVPGRTDQVLAAMQRDGYLTDGDRLDADEDLQRMRFREQTVADRDAQYFVRSIRNELPALLANSPELRERQWSGIAIRTTLDRNLQNLAEQIVAKHAEEYRNRFQVQNLSLVAIDRKTREIVAYVGNVNASQNVTGNDYDMASVPRQPGSSFKPFVYAAAFDGGFIGPDSFILDGTLTIGKQKPRNYEGGFKGWMRVKNALASSRNIPAIRAFLIAGGEEVVLNTASGAGISAPLERRSEFRSDGDEFTYGWPLAIGAAEIPLREMVQGYATIANNGMMLPLQSILGVSEAEDETALISVPSTDPHQGLDPDVAQALRDILRDPNLRPAGGWRTTLSTGSVQSAVKTGTSNQCRGVDVRTGQCTLRLPSDTWTVGFTPSYVVGVWGGNANYAALAPLADGLSVGAPIWREFVTQAHALHPELPQTFEPSTTAKNRWPKPIAPPRLQKSMPSPNLDQAPKPVAVSF